MAIVEHRSRHGAMRSWLIMSTLIILPTAGAQMMDPVQRWLLLDCDFGEQGQASGQLLAVGAQAVPQLIAAAQSGPTPSLISSRQAALSTIYDDIQASFAAGGPSGFDPGAASMLQAATRNSFVTENISRFSYSYRIHAVQGLGVVRGNGALSALLMFANDRSAPDLRDAARQTIATIADVNGDGAVDCRDLAAIRAVLGTKVGQPRFNARADINGDGVVDRQDLKAEKKLLPKGTECEFDSEDD